MSAPRPGPSPRRRRRDRRDLGLVLASPPAASPRRAIKLGSPRPGDLPPAAGRPRRGGVRDVEAAHDARGLRSRRRRDRGRRARPAGDRGRAASSAASRSTSSRTWSTSCAARWRSSARARPCPPRSSSTPSASGAGSSSSPGSPAGPRSAGRAGIPWERADRAGRLVRRSTARSWLDLKILAATPLGPGARRGRGRARRLRRLGRGLGPAPGGRAGDGSGPPD